MGGKSHTATKGENTRLENEFSRESTETRQQLSNTFNVTEKKKAKLKFYNQKKYLGNMKV